MCTSIQNISKWTLSYKGIIVMDDGDYHINIIVLNSLFWHKHPCQFNKTNATKMLLTTLCDMNESVFLLFHRHSSRIY